jgi:hypothetical protein
MPATHFQLIGTLKLDNLSSSDGIVDNVLLQLNREFPQFAYIPHYDDIKIGSKRAAVMDRIKVYVYGLNDDFEHNVTYVKTGENYALTIYFENGRKNVVDVLSDATVNEMRRFCDMFDAVFYWSFDE